MAEKKSLRDKILSKKSTVRPVKVVINGEDEEFLVKALPERMVRELRISHPPISAEDKKANSPWNTETFPPAFMAVAIQEPKLSEAEWGEIWNSDEWSLGEVRDLWDSVWQITGDGFDVPFGGQR